MKLLEVFRSSSKWKAHPTRKGVMVRSLDSDDAVRAREKENKVRTPRKKMTPEEKMRKKLEQAAARKEHKQATDQWLLNKIDNAISSSFPDGDPADYLMGDLERHGVTMDDVNRVIRKREGRKVKGFYDYLAGMWDDTQADAIHDAKNGHGTNDSVFYRLDDDGTVHPEANPWK